MLWRHDIRSQLHASQMAIDDYDEVDQGDDGDNEDLPNRLRGRLQWPPPLRPQLTWVPSWWLWCHGGWCHGAWCRQWWLDKNKPLPSSKGYWVDFLLHHIRPAKWNRLFKNVHIYLDEVDQPEEGAAFEVVVKSARGSSGCVQNWLHIQPGNPQCKIDQIEFSKFSTCPDRACACLSCEQRSGSVSPLPLCNALLLGPAWKLSLFCLKSEIRYKSW